MPSAVIALMWVTIYNGSSALSLSLVIVDTVLAPFLIPLTLRVIVGSRVQINTSSMIEELLFMIALPAVAAMSEPVQQRESQGNMAAKACSGFKNLSDVYSDL